MVEIGLSDVSKQWGDGSWALTNVDLHIESGEFFGILGPSGSGKSTLLRLMAGLERPDHGSIYFDGLEMNQIPPERRGLGHVPQGMSLYTHLTAEGNIGFPLLGRKLGREERTDTVQAHAGRFGLRRLLTRKPSQLSAGQQHLVAAGRATVLDQRLLLFDEPFATLDRPARNRIKPGLRKLHESGRTVVLATNDQSEAFALCDRIAVVSEGRILQVGKPMEVYHHPGNVFVAEFLGDPGMNIVRAHATGDSLAVGDGRLELSEPVPATGTVLVGIRPESVAPAEPGSSFARCVRGRVTLVEVIGDVSLVHLAFGGPDSGALDFVVQVPTGAGPRAGDWLETVWDVDQLSFFDPETHNRIT
jgi:multiple sugar transport system ATP-binding protein